MAERRPDPRGHPGRPDETTRGPAQLAHAPTAGPGTQHDGRSVGELLRDADHLARTLLLDLDADHAAALVRSWPTLVDAAATAWHAVGAVATGPDTTMAAAADQPPPIDDTDPMSRLQAVTDGIAGTLATARWPTPGQGSHVVDEISGHLHRVAQLLERHGADLPVRRPDVRADIAAAQMRLMHTVYLAAHATTSSLQMYGRRLHDNPSEDRKPLPLASAGLPYAVGPTGRWVQRIGVCEGIASRYVRQTHGGVAAALAGEAIPPPDEPDRLQRALARWDIQVHRTLAADPSPHNLLLASRTQALIAATASPILEGLRRREPEVGDDIGHAIAALEATGNAWNHVAGRWADLTPPGARPDRPLAAAAAQLRAALGDISRRLDQAELGRIYGADVALAVGHLHDALVSAAEVADQVRELAADPDLVGPARALSIRAHNEHELATASQPRGAMESDIVWVLPSDVLNGRTVPLPRPVADGLRRAAAAAAASAARAASRTTILDILDRTDITRSEAGIGRDRPPQRFANPPEPSASAPTP
ncbi:hypothetical protein [Nocardioides marmoraquaticus]